MPESPLPSCKLSTMLDSRSTSAERCASSASRARVCTPLALCAAFVLTGCGDDAPLFFPAGDVADATAGDVAPDAGDVSSDAADVAPDAGDVSSDADDDTSDAGDDTSDASDDASDAQGDAPDGSRDASDSGDDAPDAPPVCGNGVIEGAEACDDGNTDDETTCEYGEATCAGCSADCSESLVLYGPFCGDTELDAEFEECDGEPLIECSELGLVGEVACVACEADTSGCFEPEPFEVLNDGWEDGDSIGFNAGFLPGEMAAGCFDAGGPAVVTDVRFFYGGAGVGESFDVPIHAFLRDDDGTPESEPIFSEIAEVVASHEASVDVALDGLLLVDGEFCIAVESTVGGLPFVGRDTDGTVDREANWILLDGFLWVTSGEVGIEGDWVIRAIVEPR